MKSAVKKTLSDHITEGIADEQRSISDIDIHKMHADELPALLMKIPDADNKKAYKA